MILLDSDVLIDLIRRHPPALTWLASLDTQPIGLVGFVGMELLQGCRNRTEQQRVQNLLQNYTLYWPTQADCGRAFTDYLDYHLSHNLGIMDSLIAETAVGLKAELATFNQKHYGVIRNLQAIQPYLR